MNDFENVDQEPEAIEPQEVFEAKKRRRATSKLRRELTEDELASSGVQRFLLDEIDQSEQRVSELSEFQKCYYKADKEKAILEERMQHSIASEIMFGVSLTLGALLIGMSPSYETTKLSNYLFAIGMLLIIGGIASRMVRK